jgi:hypothetical protein
MGLFYFLLEEPMPTIDELLRKYHWAINPEIHDDLAAMAKVYRVTAVIAYDGESAVMCTETASRHVAEGWVRLQKARRTCVAIIVERGGQRRCLVRGKDSRWEVQG